VTQSNQSEAYRSKPKTELESLERTLSSQYSKIGEAKLALDLTRGKPSSEQLNLSDDLDGILKGQYILQDGTDVRNYGGLLGLPEVRVLGASILETDPAETMAGGNASLTLMHQYLAFMQPIWRQACPEGVKFICLVPGYDRHFTLCEHFNIEMVSVSFKGGDPDLDHIEALVRQDPSIKGIWCVPKYSNPTGNTYSDKAVRRLSKLAKIAGSDFRIMWDNAYAVHHLTEVPDQLTNIMAMARQRDTSDNLVIFGSTSKITYAGAGISFLATSRAMLSEFEKYLSETTIGFDKVNQLRHLLFLKNMTEIEHHMRRHAELLRPRFALTAEILCDHLGSKEIGEWSTPNGGYFVSFDTIPGLAREIITLAANVGVRLTPAGATFPYGIDPENRNIRIAPTFPALDSLRQALEVFVVCVQLASVRHYLKN
jgi:DNA-binding transcriptional MocR family regulator